MNKRLYVIGSILISMLMLFGCGSSSAGDGAGKNGTEKASAKQTDDKSKKKKKKSSDLGDFTIKLGGEITQEEDHFIIDGESNLLPGSRVVGELWVSEDEMFADTTELVDEDGKFQMKLEHHKYGEAEIIVRFDFEGNQEDEIKRHYGEKGQKLKGPLIYKHKAYGGILKKAEVRAAYDPNVETELAFKEPEWEELPADYGDPRVWIEVDDITEDGEYFYLNGKSNILEGSEIRASYGNNSDKTQVQPDGTFTFKIDYEYLEDKNFVIEFAPHSFQWNEIEEAYGKSGQKLVGDLVVTNKYNNNQTIEVEIPYTHAQ